MITTAWEVSLPNLLPPPGGLHQVGQVHLPRRGGNRACLRRQSWWDTPQHWGWRLQLHLSTWQPTVPQLPGWGPGILTDLWNWVWNVYSATWLTFPTQCSLFHLLRFQPLGAPHDSCQVRVSHCMDQGVPRLPHVWGHQMERSPTHHVWMCGQWPRCSSRWKCQLRPCSNDPRWSCVQWPRLSSLWSCKGTHLRGVYQVN